MGNQAMTLAAMPLQHTFGNEKSTRLSADPCDSMRNGKWARIMCCSLSKQTPLHHVEHGNPRSQRKQMLGSCCRPQIKS
jgi:hypothetical protein